MDSKILNQDMETQPNNPLHGKTLEAILNELVSYYGWEQMSYHVNVNSFQNESSVQSSLKFLRKTPWARKKVEDLYIKMQERKQ
ncbi:uncharacterized protein (DUF2132 family) [Dyadobacter arcticus]|uniref:Uncharacterized protein (DUF2132 family) n=2 Tax=Dyadobacter arcticus TaxID=1078754 RepID=A0ABX0UME7_9BACT|nr:uncharacterized protein (DUF2132 family) [Dyadobacter arcticus]